MIELAADASTLKLQLRANDRYAVIGKSNSGKTSFAARLAIYLKVALMQYNIANPDMPQWKIVGLDTKMSDDDVELFDAMGQITDNPQKLFIKEQVGRVWQPPTERSKRLTKEEIVLASQYIFGEAYERTHVVVYIDEYKSVVVNARDAGSNLEDIFSRGRGKRVGLIGTTQEPVYVPRQLLSQATHVFLFDLYYPRDIEVARELCPEYERPPHPHGFFYLNTDKRHPWVYFENYQMFFQMLQSA